MARMYFEKLSPGLKAKLDARYRIKTSRGIKDTGDIGSGRLLRNYFGMNVPNESLSTLRDRITQEGL
jgi:hypothetical protein